MKKIKFKRIARISLACFYVSLALWLMYYKNDIKEILTNNQLLGLIILMYVATLFIPMEKTKNED